MTKTKSESAESYFRLVGSSGWWEDTEPGHPPIFQGTKYDETFSGCDWEVAKQRAAIRIDTWLLVNPKYDPRSSECLDTRCKYSFELTACQTVEHVEWKLSDPGKPKVKKPVLAHELKTLYRVGSS